MTISGDSRKARKLRVGDAVLLKGQRWDVARAKRDKAAGTVAVRFTRGAERIDGDVPDTRAFELWTEAAQPLTSPTGAQNRWATTAEAEHAMRQPVVHDDDETPELDPWVPSTEAEQAVASIMGGTLIGAQREPDTGLWFVPPVDGSTVMAHLLAFHATEPESRPTAEVRTPMAEQLDTAAEALMRADISGALTLHAQQHTDGLPDGATPHRHA